MVLRGTSSVYGETFEKRPLLPNPGVRLKFYTQWSFSSILEIFNVFLWLKFSPSLALNKIEHFSKVSWYLIRPRKTIEFRKID